MQENYKSSKHSDTLAILIDLIPDPVIILDSTGQIIAANKMIEKLTGYKKEQLIGKIFSSLNCFNEENKILLAKKVRKRLAGSTFSPYEIKVKVMNGDVKCLKVNGNKFINEGEAVDLVILNDVTEEKKNQNELRQDLFESEEKFQVITNSVKEAIITVDQDAIVTYWNPAAENIFGYTGKEAIGKSVHELVIPKSTYREGKERIETSVKTFSETGMGYFTVGNVELVGRRKNGSEFPAELAISPVKLCGKLNAVGVVTDITKRKLNEQKLKETEQRYHALFNQAPLGVLVVDPETAGFVEFNDVAHLQLGYSREEFEQMNVYDIEAIESPEKIKSHIKALVTERGSEFETGHRTKTGEIKNILVTTKTVNSAGKTFLHCVYHDITEFKKVQNALIESEERFRAISTSAMDAIILSDEEDKVIYWNPAAEKTFGFKENEAVGRKLKELVIPLLGHPKHEELLKEVLIQPVSKKYFGLLALKKDGSSFPMDLNVVSIKLKDKQCLLSTIRDITESKAMEEALRQERDMLENMAASIDAGLTIIGRDYRILWGNKLLKQISGNDLENKLCYSIYNKSDESCHDCGVRKVFENGATVDRHDYNYKFDGRDEWVELIATPVKDKNGKVIAALELVVNITERKKLQTKLGEYSQKLEELVQKRTVQLKNTQLELVKSERLAAIGELAGMIGHDLRNPLTGIKNSAYFLKKKGNEISRAQAQEMLEIIDKCVNYSNKIVNDLLEYSREVHLESHEESIKKLLTESLSLLDLPEKIEIKNHLNDEPTVKVDADKIKRVFINLIKNAADAMPNGGRVTIDSKQINGRLEVSFSDTGRGISDEVLPKLFMPLFTTKAQGMGFGLAICKRIIEAHGGTITVMTVKEKGTSFTITLPIEPKFQVGGENT